MNEIDLPFFLSKCKCYEPPFNSSNFERFEIGVDNTNSRYGEISKLVCKICNQTWVEYFVEFEAFKESGRWYRSEISNFELSILKPNETQQFIENKGWFFYGGSYFKSNGKIGKGKINVD